MRAPLVLALAVAACARPPAEAAPKPMTAHLVARVATRSANVHALTDGAVLDTGLFVYALRGRGAPVLVGDVPGYAPLLEPTPYARHARREHVAGTRDRLVIDGYVAEERWEGGAWHRTAHDEHGARQRIGLHPPVVLPSRYDQLTWAQRSDATWVGVGVDWQTRNTMSIVVRPPSPDPEIVPFDREYTSCRIVQSVDGHAYAACWTPQTNRLLRLDGKSWVPVPAQHLPNVAYRGWSEDDGPVAVDGEGTVWYADPDMPLRLRRFRNGHHDQVDLPDETFEWPLAFDGTRVRRRIPSKPTAIVTVEAAPGGEVWVVAQDREDHRYVFRVGGAPPPAPAYIGEEMDQRAAVENAVGPKPAVGHCAPLFVPLVTSRGATFDLARARSGRTAIVKVLDDMTTRQHHAYPVIGWYGERRAAGVILIEEDEAALHDLVEAFSEDPSAPPRPSCTMPVVEGELFYD